MEERGGVVKAKVDNDITFLIGVEPFTEIIPAKAKPLAERSPVFRAMLEGPLAEDRGRLINIQVKTVKHKKIPLKKSRTSTRGLCAEWTAKGRVSPAECAPIISANARSSIRSNSAASSN